MVGGWRGSSLTFTGYHVRYRITNFHQYWGSTWVPTGGTVPGTCLVQYEVLYLVLMMEMCIGSASLCVAYAALELEGLYQVRQVVGVAIAIAISLANCNCHHWYCTGSTLRLRSNIVNVKGKGNGNGNGRTLRQRVERKKGSTP